MRNFSNVFDFLLFFFLFFFFFFFLFLFLFFFCTMHHVRKDPQRVGTNFWCWWLWGGGEDHDSESWLSFRSRWECCVVRLEKIAAASNLPTPHTKTKIEWKRYCWYIFANTFRMFPHVTSSPPCHHSWWLSPMLSHRDFFCGVLGKISLLNQVQYRNDWNILSPPWRGGGGLFEIETIEQILVPRMTKRNGQRGTKNAQNEFLAHLRIIYSQNISINSICIFPFFLYYSSIIVPSCRKSSYFSL